MEISTQAFVFSWPGLERRAAGLEARLEPLVPVTVIHSGLSMCRVRPHWHCIADTAHFSEQWNTARRLFAGDLLFHVQADAQPAKLADIVARAQNLFTRYPIGVYEPNVDYTDIVYDTVRLRRVTDDVVEVPWTDCTCWFIRADVVRAVPPFDLAINQFGWGLSRVAAAICRLHGLLCVRDYGFTVVHPRRRGYPSEQAMQQLHAYIRTCPTAVRREVARLETLRRCCAQINMRGRPPQPS